MISSNLKECLPLIQRYCRLRSQKEKKKFLKKYEDCIMRACQEMSLNTLNGNVSLTSDQKKRLRRYKRALIALSKHSLPRVSKRKIILQKGGGLFTALVPLVVSAVIGALQK